MKILAHTDRLLEHLIIKLLWKDLDKEFEEKLNEFRLNVKAIEKQAGLSNMIEANEGWALVQLHRKGRFSIILDRRNQH